MIEIRPVVTGCNRVVAQTPARVFESGKDFRTALLVQGLNPSTRTRSIGMYMYTQGHSRLISTGVYLPEERVTSREIMEQFDSENRLGVSVNWIEKTMGIKERRVA